MHKAVWLTLLAILMAYASLSRAEQTGLEYPCAVLDLHDADSGCWTGMDAAGGYPRPVVPERWLVGPPPSAESGVTVPTDHWIDLAFSGGLVNGDGNDITLVETGKAGEQALLFLTDGGDREYLLTRVDILNLARQELSHIGLDLAGLSLPFVPRAVRLVALDLGGQSPGFDLGSVQARVSHECGLQATWPNPVSGAGNLRPLVRLTWVPPCSVGRQVLYLSTVESQVRRGEAVVRYPLPPDVNAFETPTLRIGETYYWRVDGLAGADGTVLRPGDVWSFTVADRFVVDDFEGYDLWEHFLYESWRIAGRADVSLEPVVFHSCHQSMVLQYHYDATYRSEIGRVFQEPQDWARSDATTLQLMLSGTAGNTTTGRLYVALNDGQTEQAVSYRGDLSLLTDPVWHPLRIDLADFNEIDLAHVTGIAIGLRPATTDPTGRGKGIVYLDDITLLPPSGSEAERPAADLTADGTVDYRDVQRLVADWLREASPVLAVAAPNEPVLWYEFEGDATDRLGRAHGQIQGRCNFVPGVYGQAIRFMSRGDAVVLPNATVVFGGIRDAITIAFWQRGEDSMHLNDTILCTDYIYGRSNPAIAIHLGCWKNPGHYRWDCGAPWSFENRLAGRHGDKAEWTGRWNHWAFTKDVAQLPSAGESEESPPGAGVPHGRRGRMEIYLNGRLYDSRAGTDTPIKDVVSLWIGSGWYGHYDGLLDDLQIFDYALSPAEIAWVATDGTGLLPEPADLPTDLKADGTVDLRDFAALAAEWLESSLRR